MDSLIVPTSPESPLAAAAASAVGAPNTEIWEVVLVASCPVIFIVFLCLCVICLVVRSYEQPNIADVRPIRRQNTPIASILRQLPPPPKYDIAVLSVDAPPPLYTDIGKEPPLRTTPSGGRPILHRQFAEHRHLTTPTVQPLNIQYLYPPRYEAAVDETANKPNATTTTPPRVAHVVVELTPSSSSGSSTTSTSTSS
ncbi:unnamed protein product [Caenorhabditis bovis]|uniref:Uncharacterized protein n=1 Tax=Caenorhabditis bovis TaxID=2654633 RepID=A0A8S1F091_9PELO|nr:unnamed protein product [Caenorhabditis bovis]